MARPWQDLAKGSGARSRSAHDPVAMARGVRLIGMKGVSSPAGKLRFRAAVEGLTSKCGLAPRPALGREF
jgi:hypothetical protein